MIAGNLATGPVWAQPLNSTQVGGSPPTAASAGGVTLAAALNLAWQRAVAAREAEGQHRRAEAERATAQSLWATPPALEFSHRNDRLPPHVGTRETEIGVALALWLPGQRAARAASVAAAVAHALAAEQVARLRLAGELREVAWLLVAAQLVAQQTGDQAQSLKQLADDAERRVVAGDLARADALAAQADHLAAAAAQFEAQQRLQAAHARWHLLTGATAAPDRAALHEPGGAGHAGASVHPELQWARDTTRLAQQRVELMRSSRREAPELTLGYRQDAAGRGGGSQGSVVVGLRLALGTDGRNAPLEAAALSELDVALAHEQRLRERLELDAATAREALRAAEAQLEAETMRARLLQERAALIDKSYRAGQTPLPELLRALAARAQAASAAAQQTAALGLAHARLQQTLGVLP